MFSILWIFKLIDFLIFNFERTWWKLFQKHAMCTNFDIYVSITVIWYLRVYYCHLISTCSLLSFDIYVSITVIWYLRVHYCHLISTCLLLSFDIYVSITVSLITCGNYWYDGIFHYEERSRPIKVNLSQPFFSLKCQEQARKVSCHVHVCKCYPFFLFLRFFKCSKMRYFFFHFIATIGKMFDYNESDCMENIEVCCRFFFFIYCRKSNLSEWVAYHC